MSPRSVRRSRVMAGAPACPNGEQGQLSHDPHTSRAERTYLGSVTGSPHSRMSDQNLSRSEQAR